MAPAIPALLAELRTQIQQMQHAVFPSPGLVRATILTTRSAVERDRGRARRSRGELTMARKDAIGHMDCPERGFDRAEVREDKSANLYRYCPACSAQYFTRGEAQRERNLRAKMRPVPGRVTESVPTPARAVPVTESAPVAAPAPAAAAAPSSRSRRRVGLLLEDPR